MKKRTKRNYKLGDVELDSKGEMDFAMYLEELRREGYISHWERGKSYQITDGLIHRFTEEKKLKTKVKQSEKTQVLLEPSFYTPDFMIVWNKRAEGIFYRHLQIRDKIATPFICDGDKVSIVECKPSLTFDPNNMLRLFRVNQKFMWKVNGVFVNLIINEPLFRASFTPQGVDIPKDRKTKKDKWKRVTLKEYLQLTRS